MAFVAIPALLISQASVISARDPAALFTGWDAFTLIPVFCSAFGGMCVGQVTKNLGGIAKGFAIVGGLVLTGAAQGAQVSEKEAMDLCGNLINLELLGGYVSYEERLLAVSAAAPFPRPPWRSALTGFF